MDGEKAIDQMSAKHLKILYVVNVLCIGGTELFLLRKIRQLRMRGHFVALAYVEERGEEVRSFLEAYLENKEVYRVSYQFDEILELIKKLEIDVLHTVQAHPFFIRSARKCQQKLSCFSTVTANVWEADQKFDHRRYTDAIITKSSDFKKIIFDKLSKPPKNIVSIPNGADLEEFSPNLVSKEQVAAKLQELQLPENAKIILHVSRVVPFKNIEASINIAARLIEESELIYFLHVGGYPESQENYYQSLRRLVDERGLAKRYLFLGEQSDIKIFLALAKIFLLTTKTHEGTPNAVLEALSMGKPVVAFNCQGIKDLVLDGQTGFRVPIDEVNEAVGRIKLLLEHKTLYRAISENCSSFVRANFSIEKAIEAYESLYLKSFDENCSQVGSGQGNN